MLISLPFIFLVQSIIQSQNWSFCSRLGGVDHKLDSFYGIQQMELHAEVALLSVRSRSGKSYLVKIILNFNTLILVLEILRNSREQFLSALNLYLPQSWSIIPRKVQKTTCIFRKSMVREAEELWGIILCFWHFSRSFTVSNHLSIPSQ